MLNCKIGEKCMRKKESLKEKWIIKTFRIKKEVIFLYSFLEFYILYIKDLDISKNEIFDFIVRDSIKYMTENNISIERTQERAKRVVKGFSIREDTLDVLDTLFSEHEYMYKAEVVEFLIVLYLRNNVTREEAEPFLTFFNSLYS